MLTTADTQTAKSQKDSSPFHAGEQELQSRVGKREEIEQFSRQAMRRFMPDQHRTFFSQLPFMVVGAVDQDGWPWASLLAGRPGFIQSPDRTTLAIDSLSVSGDPVRDSLKDGAPVGLLGIEMHTRRRNRMNGHIKALSDCGFTVGVDLSFGNCPQYIQHRAFEFVREPGETGQGGNPVPFSELDEKARVLIENSDAFFVSSYVQARDNPTSEGVDVSHRGGRPGFVKIEGNTLTIPDFPGNYLFNTFGNFLLNPKAGLVFIDFATGDLLTLTGTVEVLAEDHEEVAAFKGAQRAWRFTLDHGVWLHDALPFRAELGEFSPNSLLTDTWQDANARQIVEQKRDAWRSFRVARVEDESSVIRSFYLEPEDGDVLLPFEAGQYLTLRVKSADKPLIRTYTVSSAPGDPFYRISVKRESEGKVSRLLHETLQTGDLIEARAPRGDFYIDPTETRPAVLLAGGVGITPMMAMARHVAIEGLRTRHLRPLTIFHSAQTTDQRAFGVSLKELEKSTGGQIRYYSLVSRPAEEEVAGKHFNAAGYITAEVLRQTLALDDYDFFLCGPPAFMQALYDTLRTLGVRDGRIMAESFGPATLKRSRVPDAVQVEPEEEADAAIVKFSRSEFEQRWNKGDETLLEFAESHGVNPEFSCRSGSCGSCVTKLKSGAVAYRTPVSAPHAEDEVVLCCAVPAKGVDEIELDL
ncbi:MAG: pyridoxamine 5'-phosphate oxidase family protein [Stappiaceae bacterium]